MPEPALSAAAIDYTLLKPQAAKAQREKFIGTARQRGYASVCLPPCWVTDAAESLKGSGVAVCTVVGFPLGHALAAVKHYEAEQALKSGATEIDWVWNLHHFFSEDFPALESELQQASTLAHQHNATLKVIVETGLMETAHQLQTAVELVAASGAHYLKTSTGMLGPGPDAALIRQIRTLPPQSLKIKASGGIRTPEKALALLQAGAHRLGASTDLLA